MIQRYTATGESSAGAAKDLSLSAVKVEGFRSGKSDVRRAIWLEFSRELCSCNPPHIVTLYSVQLDMLSTNQTMYGEFYNGRAMRLNI